LYHISPKEEMEERSRSFKGSEIHKSNLGVFGSVLITRMLIIEGNVKFKGGMGFNTGSGI